MIFKYLTKSFYINLSIIFLIFFLDRASKLYVIYLDKKNLNSKLFSSEFLNIDLIWNEGIAFGLFSFNQNNFYNALTFIIAIIIILILVMTFYNIGLKKYSLLIIFSGALGNLFDRIFYKAVPDFIDLHINNFHWFIFNVSDIFITFGVMLMIVLEITSKDDQNKNYEKM
jgi:signal peptidase II